MIQCCRSMPLKGTTALDGGLSGPPGSMTRGCIGLESCERAMKMNRRAITKKLCRFSYRASADFFSLSPPDIKWWERGAYPKTYSQ